MKWMAWITILKQKQSFQALIETNQLVEYDFYHGNYYGVGVAAIVETTKEHPAYNALTFPGFKRSLSVSASPSFQFLTFQKKIFINV